MVEVPGFAARVRDSVTSVSTCVASIFLCLKLAALTLPKDTLAGSKHLPAAFTPSRQEVLALLITQSPRLMAAGSGSRVA